MSNIWIPIVKRSRHNDMAKEINFCESCVEGKYHFPTIGGKRSKELLGLVHSDLCGKMS